MKNAMQINWQWCAKFTLICCLLCTGINGFAGEPLNTTPTPECLECAAPSVAKTSQSSGTVTYAWSAVSGATAYEVWYINLDTNTSSSVTSTSATNITFSGLAPGHYRVYFRTICGEGSSNYITDDLLM